MNNKSNERSKPKGKPMKKLLLALAAAMLLVMGTAVSFFTDTDSISNGFTVGNISIELTEPTWKPENGINITPNKKVEKDPQITNNGVNDAYVFMKIKIPTANIATAGSDGSLNEAAVQELFTYETGEEWKLVNRTVETGNVVYVYGYTGDDGNMKVLSSGHTTSPLFDSITFVNAVEGQLDKKSLDVDVEAMGIQTEDLGVYTPEGIYDIFAKQIK